MQKILNMWERSNPNEATDAVAATAVCYSSYAHPCVCAHAHEHTNTHTRAYTHGHEEEDEDGEPFVQKILNTCSPKRLLTRGCIPTLSTPTHRTRLTLMYQPASTQQHPFINRGVFFLFAQKKVAAEKQEFEADAVAAEVRCLTVISSSVFKLCCCCFLLLLKSLVQKAV